MDAKSNRELSRSLHLHVQVRCQRPIWLGVLLKYAFMDTKCWLIIYRLRSGQRKQKKHFDFAIL